MKGMFLDKIVAEKREEIEQRQQTVPLPELEAAIKEKPTPLDMAAALKGDSLSLIAEIKRASPSKGVLSPDLDPIKLAQTYAQCEAVAISVLTESHYFGGSGEDLEAVRRELPDTPLLRKDFILKPYQIYESRARGAHALLLIVAILDDSALKELLSLSHELRMKCLVETHNEDELTRALATDAEIIGINNRNLDTMAVDINVTRNLRPLIPPDRIVVSESGITVREDIKRLRELGVNVVLIGEALVTASDAATKIKELF